MKRRRFEFLVVELSVAVGRLIPRYALWLRLNELGWDPVALAGEELISFYDQHLQDFLAEHDLLLTQRESRRLRKKLVRFDPRHDTPYEIMERLVSSRH